MDISLKKWVRHSDKCDIWRWLLQAGREAWVMNLHGVWRNYNVIARETAGEVNNNQLWKDLYVMWKSLSFIIKGKWTQSVFHRTLWIVLPLDHRSLYVILMWFRKRYFSRHWSMPGHLAWRKGMPWISFSNHWPLLSYIRCPDSGFLRALCGVTNKGLPTGSAVIPFPPHCRNHRKSAFVIYRQL